MSVKELTDTKQLRVWPNPCNNFIYITATGQQNRIARIYDALGRQVMIKELQGNQAILTEQLEPGIYNLQVESEQHAPLKTRFIKN